MPEYSALVSIENLFMKHESYGVIIQPHFSSSDVIVHIIEFQHLRKLFDIFEPLQRQGNKFLPTNPTVKNSVPSFMMMALLVSNGLPKISSTTASLNLITSSVFSSFPQLSCYSHERPLLGTFLPSNSTVRQPLIFVDLVVEMIPGNIKY